ncbi:MAG TPA: phage major capsid protein [Candidatus Cloacimonetes bacterium]|nr:phage major capsid protein [Candidatus Cloacimonadota bacterium]
MKTGKNLGLLSAKTTDKFLDMVIANAPILQLCTAPKVDLPIGTYPVVNMTQYKTRGFSNAHNANGGRQTVATMQNMNAADVSYAVKELVLPLIIQDSYAEDMETSPEKIAEMFAKVFAKDLSQLIINGDTELEQAGDTATDRETMLKILDGLLKQMVTAENVVEYGATQNTVEKKIIKLISGCPDDYLVNPDSRLIISPTDMNLLWEEATTKRPIIKERDGKLYFRGKYLIEEIGGFPQNAMIFGDLTGLLTPLSRELYLETQRYPEARGWKAVLSARLDCVIHPFINARLLVPEAEEVDPDEPAGGN